MCCMTKEVCGALPAEAMRSGAHELPLVAHAIACHVFPGATSTCMCAAAERPERPAHVRSVTLEGLRQHSGCRCAGAKSTRLQRWHAARLFRCPLSDPHCGASV